jgi:hypothetical protein
MSRSYAPFGCRLFPDASHVTEAPLSNVTSGLFCCREHAMRVKISEHSTQTGSVRAPSAC